MRDAENASGNKIYVVSWDAVSAALGTTARQWITYSKRPGFPKKTDQGYDLSALATWKAENVRARSGDGDLAARKAAKLDLEAELLRLRIEKEKRLSVLRSEVDELHGRMAMKLRAFLYAKLENEMPPKFAGCDALTLRRYGREMADQIVDTLAKDIDQWNTA